MRVVWASFAPLRKTDQGPSSDVASVRYRLTLPARALPGSKVTYIGAGANRRTLLERFADADAVVFGKLFDPALAPMALELAMVLRERAIKVVADYSDDHFMHPNLGAAYRAMANAADLLVASTPALAEVVRAYASSPVCVVGDPVEGERGEARASTSEPPRLLWFGYPLNLQTLRDGLPQIKNCDLTIMTVAGAGAEELGQRFRPWSTRALFEELRACEAVIIPSNPHDPHKAVKSPNRFTEALWAGRFVIAHPLPAYQPLAPYGWVGEDMGEGLEWLQRHESQALERIRAGQAWVAEHCSPETIARAWRTAIGG